MAPGIVALSEVAKHREKFSRFQSQYDADRAAQPPHVSAATSSQQDSAPTDHFTPAPPQQSSNVHLPVLGHRLDIDPPLDSSLELNLYYLYLEDADGRQRLVGRGKVRNTQNQMIHCSPITPGYVEVMFMQYIEAEKHSLLPKLCDEVVMVGTAVGYFLEWPIRLVSLHKKNVPPLQKRARESQHVKTER